MTVLRVCSTCVMDTTDPEIEFDDQGSCSHCRNAERMLKTADPYCLPAAEKALRFASLAEAIRRDGKRKRYDCVIGVSGGVDSSYAAYVVKKAGLRPLAVHLDNGWDSELAVMNVESFLKKLDIDLSTFVIDWNEFKDLQLSFLKASTPDSEIPSDHAIISILYRTAAKWGVRYILGGTNLSTESILPRRWSHGHADWKYIRSVHGLFGRAKLKTFPHMTLLQEIFYRRVIGIQWISILDYCDYVKRDAMRVLGEELGWRDYGGKHHESLYTRFYQAHILPAKFGFDKRKAHLSSLIVSGQITRERALEELQKPLYEPALLKEHTEYFIGKLGISEQIYKEIMQAPPKRFGDYPSYERSWYFQFLRKAYGVVKGLARG
ncbi:MAG: N-acetyl sugar amidotransferase [Elusimicrobia bacterium]|nr:N-acetyl sugar amidotransferase [Elusimicrobiota bacterium]